MAILGISRKKKVQASMGAEGARQDLTIVDGITWARTGAGVPGLANPYLTYGSQVEETYRKYNGKAEYGCASVRVIVDTRTAFIAGEGISISATEEGARFRKWVQAFLKASKLSGSLFFDTVMGTEMTGRALFLLYPVLGASPKVVRVPYNRDSYKVSSDGTRLFIKNADGTDTEVPSNQFVFVRTGGDDVGQEEPATRVGLVLTDCENYERALKDIRLTNYTTSRITPTFKTDSDEDTKTLATELRTKGWKIGQAFVGKATFKYEGADSGALENLKMELSCGAKNISAVTGVPVHWFGWTDLMSNRATAEDLYQMISNATLRERTLIAEGIYDLLVKAQIAHIDAGGGELGSVFTDFTVTIPSIDYGRFESMVRALSVAYNDEAISIDDYRSAIPGIDPLQTKKAVDEARKASAPPTIDLLKDDEDDKEENKKAPMPEPKDKGGEK